MQVFDMDGCDWVAATSQEEAIKFWWKGWRGSRREGIPWIGND